MINGLRRGPDGWIYACHGFNNQSNVTAKDGSSVKLISGNTFRFRDDGSRIEQWTSGQVNPFGLAVDDWGNLTRLTVTVNRLQHCCAGAAIRALVAHTTAWALHLR